MQTACASCSSTHPRPHGPCRTRPERQDLEAVLRRLDAKDVRLEGLPDHGVSEAIYLPDPEGNGIETYRDRELEAWPRNGDEIAMHTEPLDVDGLLAETDQARPLPAETRLGQVHLSVDELDPAREFFEAVGITVSQSMYPSAMFPAAGDHHHHVGLNTWRTRPRPDDAPHWAGSSGMSGTARSTTL